MISWSHLSNRLAPHSHGRPIILRRLLNVSRSLAWFLHAAAVCMPPAPHLQPVLAAPPAPSFSISLSKVINYHKCLDSMGRIYAAAAEEDCQSQWSPSSDFTHMLDYLYSVQKMFVSLHISLLWLKSICSTFYSHPTCLIHEQCKNSTSAGSITVDNDPSDCLTTRWLSRSRCVGEGSMEGRVCVWLPSPCVHYRRAHWSALYNDICIYGNTNCTFLVVSCRLSSCAAPFVSKSFKSYRSTLSRSLKQAVVLLLCALKWSHKHISDCKDKPNNSYIQVISTVLPLHYRMPWRAKRSVDSVESCQGLYVQLQHAGFWPRCRASSVRQERVKNSLNKS